MSAQWILGVVCGVALLILIYLGEKYLRGAIYAPNPGWDSASNQKKLRKFYFTAALGIVCASVSIYLFYDILS